MSAAGIAARCQRPCRCGPFDIDYEWGLDNKGIWAQKNQNLLEYAAPAVGYWSTRREIPISVQLLPRGLTFGVYYHY
jgi:hypothetical protein